MSSTAVSGADSERTGANGGERQRKISSQASPYWYCSCGLSIRSELELPELVRVDPHSDGQNQVDILLGDVPKVLQNGRPEAPWLQANSRQCLVGSKNIARYLVEDGARITVDRRVEAPIEASASHGDVRTYLLGTVLGALLHQRQWLPLHISAVRTATGAIAFTGPSGAGKSTLAAYSHYRLNLPLVSDDIAILKPDDAEPLLYPGPPRLKLWTDAIQALGLSSSGMIRDLAREEKFHLHRNLDFQREPLPLKNLVLLTKADLGQPALVRRIRGIEAYRVFMQAIYRPALCHLFFNQSRLHDFGSRIASQIAVYEYRRPWKLDALEPSLDRLFSAML